MFVNLATNKISFDDPAKQALYDYVEESIRAGLLDDAIISMYMSTHEDYTPDDIAFLRFVLAYIDLIEGRTQVPKEKYNDIVGDINKRARELLAEDKEFEEEYSYLIRKETAIANEYLRKSEDTDEEDDREEQGEDLQEDDDFDQDEEEDKEDDSKSQSDDACQDFDALLDKFIKEQLEKATSEEETN
ncbi:MAG: hypothetical protein J6P90_01980, partial [Rikenellaceae bacterium]|nr:hypothetical protein [Rikenellaceae bacterium]